MLREIKAVAAVLLAGLFLCAGSADARKNSISVGKARKELGEVAAFQGFPQRYRLDRMGSLEVEYQYFHIFYSYMKETDRWRTLVYDNNSNYLGFYETVDPPVDLERDGVVFPGPSYSSETGDFEEGQFDSGDAHIIRFSTEGPPDLVKFENITYEFQSSPKRIRPADPGFRFLQAANRIAGFFNNSRYKRVRDDFSNHALKRISEEQAEEILSGVRDKLGRIRRVGAPWVQSPDTAILPLTFDNAVAGLKLTLTDEGKILGLWILPFKTAFPDVGVHDTQVQMPMKGRWRVLWGGSEREQSKYFGSRVSHNSLEFVVSSRFNKTYKGEGKKNKEFFAYGQPVLAPAAGTVVAVINGVPDNKPRSPNPFDRLGNAVMIQHSTNEYSVVGHLLNHSITVKEGDEVKTLQPIARCGNSGDSSQPSIYFHVQDSPRILAGSGYFPVFSNLYVWKNNELGIKEIYSPVRGDFVQQRLVAKPEPEKEATEKQKSTEAAQSDA